MITQQELQSRLEDAARELKVPGAAVAVCQDGAVVSAVTGVTNVTTGQAVAPDTLFAAGSVTKVFTATLLMTLVDDGLVDLDVPVVKYLPTFTVGDDPRSAEVTVRMLLSHASGLPGSFTYDIAKGPDTVTRFVDLLRDFELNSPPGKYWSYSNAGLVAAGRVAEIVTGQTFDAALAERVLRPLGLNATTDTDEMILGTTAVGHVVDVSGNVRRVPRFQLGTNGPSGSSLACDIAALVSFGRMHLEGGRSEAGDQVLSAESVAAMQTQQIGTPWGLGYDGFGLGWSIRRSGDHTVFNHSGAGAGQHSVLTILPGQQGLVAALTNSTTGAALYTKLLGELLEEYFDVRSPTPPAAPAAAVEVDIEPLTGVYEADCGSLIVTDEDGALWVEHEVEPEFAETMRLIYGDVGFPPPPMRLTPFATDGRFLSDIGMPVEFVTPAGSDAVEYAYAGRIYRRKD